MQTQDEKPISSRMTPRLLLALLCLLGAAGIGVASGAHAATLKAFTSETDLLRYMRRLPPRIPPPPPPPPAAAPEGAAASLAAAAPGSITNVQEAGVDEGDIVKLHGDKLVILRRGRLFTIGLGGNALHPIDAINAYPPGIDAHGDWYDEMLIAGDRIVVIGYSYGRGGTQINRFHVSGDGHLAFADAYHLRSNDYYSSRNYASRLIGNRLIVYTPRYLPYEGGDPFEALPALRRWNPDRKDGGFERIGTAREVYLPPAMPIDQITTVHTIVSCDLAAIILHCKATSVFGPDSRSFYVSTHAVYVWVSPWWGENGPGTRAASLLYRLPLDGGAPSAIGARGAPVDQFSFREDAGDGMLNVVVRSDSKGDAMWLPEFSAGAVALLRFPLRGFGDGMREVDRDRYRTLPQPGGNAYDFHNRFVGDYLLYGNGNGWGTPQNAGAGLVIAPVRGGAVTQLALPHGVDRIEVLGPDAVVVGSDANNVYFSAVDLAHGPRLGDGYVFTGAAQAETRSHGFFFHPDSGDAASGVLGLPVARPGRPAYRQLTNGSAAMIFLRRSGGKFSPLGELGAHVEGVTDDHCAASCVDWYGNARPIFIGGRTFALMGYELVEGALTPDAIRETGRITFAPATDGPAKP